MTNASSVPNTFFTHDLAHWLESKSNDPSTISKINYHLCGRVALIGASLFSLTTAVSQTAIGYIVYIGYSVFFPNWAQAREFSADQLQKGDRAGFVGLSCLRSIPCPKELAKNLSAKQPGTNPPTENQEPQIQGQKEPATETPPVREATPEEREMRVILNQPDRIKAKLEKQFECAQTQNSGDGPSEFVYRVATADFTVATESTSINGREVGICYDKAGKPTKMEDEHLATSFKLNNVAGKAYLVELYGVFDGHGGGAASIYVKDNLARKLQEMLVKFCANGLSDEAIWNALKMTFVELNKEFTEPKSGTTATVTMILDEKLWTANVGDSRTILDDGTQLSEDAKANYHRYIKGITRRGGKIQNRRINDTLEPARAIGDRDVGPGVSARPKITALPLAKIPKGSHLILASDGIYSWSSTKEIASAVKNHNSLSATELAKNIVYSVSMGLCTDNLTALIVKL